MPGKALSKLTPMELAWRQSDNIVNPFLSPEEDAAALKVFQSDPRPFIEQYLKINTKEGKVTDFKFNRGQQIVHAKIQEYREKKKPVRFIVLKARQVGISTLIEALIFWRMRFWKHTDARIVSFETGSAGKIFNMTELYYESLPENLRPLKYRRTKGMLIMGNPDETTRLYHPGLMSGVEIGTAKNIHIGRGSHYQCAHLTEVALWKDAYATTRSILQCIPSQPETYAFIESTSDGADGYFYDEFMRARDRLTDLKGTNELPEWCPIFLPFWLDYEDNLTHEEMMAIADSADEYEKSLKQKIKGITWGNISWRRTILAEKCQGNKAIFDLEYAPTVDEAFAAAGQTVFDKQSLMWYRENTIKNGRVGKLIVPDTGMMRRPYFVEDPNGPLTIWEFPREGMSYGIGCDAALGKAAEEGLTGTDLDEAVAASDADFCAGVVLSKEMHQVAEYNSRVIAAFDFADEMANLGHFYNTAMIMPEVGGQGAGYAIQKRFKEVQYPLIGRWEKIDDVKRQKLVSALGWEMNYKTKAILIGEMQREIMRGAGRVLFKTVKDERHAPRLVLRSIDLLRELQVFANLGDGGMGAKKGNHDDLVVALGLAIKALEQVGDYIPAGVIHAGGIDTGTILEHESDYSFWEV